MWIASRRDGLYDVWAGRALVARALPWAEALAMVRGIRR